MDETRGHELRLFGWLVGDTMRGRTRSDYLYNENVAMSFMSFLLAGPSQNVFLLPHIPWEGGQGVEYFLYINL